MISTRAFRAAGAVAVLSAGVWVGGLSNVARAGAAASPQLVVKYSGPLTNGTIVTVSGSGFKAKDQVYITECLATAVGPAQCDIATAVPVKISTTGVLPVTKFKVVTGKIGTGSCGTKLSNLKSCALSVGNASGGDTGSIRVTFAKPLPQLVVKYSGPLTNGTIVTVSGSGFKAKDQVYITECLATAVGPAQCDIATAVPVKISTTGVLPVTKFKVVTGKIGTGSCGTKLSNLKSCALSVGNASGGDTATVRVTFATPKK